jgi:uncharacterized SAM-binding protein YcdF (DUF218 family)
MARRIQEFLQRLWRIARLVLQAGGLAGLVVALLCFTPVPWRLYRWLSTGPAPARSPAFIVVLGGGGIPSETGLMRTYEAAGVARRFPKARLIVALPSEGDPETGATGRMKAELVLRGVAARRILLEPQGRNTREQALNAAGMIPGPETNAVLVVTSPEHLKRAVWSFRKAGLGNAAGAPAFEESADYELSYDQQSGGPDLGRLPMLRYDFWNNLGYLERSARELAALAYYRWMGWI